MKRRLSLLLILAALIIPIGSLLINKDVHGLVTSIDVTEIDNSSVAFGDTDFAISHSITGSGIYKPSNYTEFCKFDSENYVLLTDHSYYLSTSYIPMIPAPVRYIDHSFDLSALTAGSHTYYYRVNDGDDNINYSTTWSFVVDHDLSSVYVNYSTDQSSDIYLANAPTFTIGGYDNDAVYNAWIEYDGQTFARPDVVDPVAPGTAITDTVNYKPDDLHKVTGLTNHSFEGISLTESWSKYKTVSIDLLIGSAGSTIDDYVAYVKVDYDSDMQSDFEDIRFTDTSNNDLYFELESKTDGVEAHYWVRIDNFDDYEHTVRVHYGNANAASGEDVANTWSSGWVLVQHMNEASGTLEDSSSQSNDYDSSSGTPIYQQTGAAGYAVDLDGSSYFESSGTFSGLHNLNNHFIFALIKPDYSHSATGYLFDQEDFYLGYENYGTDYAKASTDGTALSGMCNGINTGSWRSLMAHGYAGTHVRFHLDGSQTDAKTESGNTDSDAGTAILGSGIYGLVDELRIFNDYKDSSFALAIHRNTIQYSTYVSTGSETSSTYEQVVSYDTDNSVTQITASIQEDLNTLDFGDSVTVEFSAAVAGTLTFGCDLNFSRISKYYWLKENYNYNHFVASYSMPESHFDNLSDGWFFFNITLNDFTGGPSGTHENYTKSLYLKKVTNAAIVDILNPVDQSSYKLGDPINLVWTVTAQTENYTETTYLNGSVQEYTTGSSILLSAGTWIFSVEVLDQAGFYNFTSVTFYVKEYVEARITYKTVYSSKIDFDVFSTYVTIEDQARTPELNGFFEMQADQTVRIETYSDFDLLLHNQSYSYNETIFITLNVHFVQFFNTNNVSAVMDVSLRWQTDTTNESLSFSLPSGAISEPILIYRQLDYIITWGALGYETETVQTTGYNIQRGTIALSLDSEKHIPLSLNPAALISYFTVGFFAVRFVLSMRPEVIKNANKHKEEKIKTKTWYLIRWLSFVVILLGITTGLIALFDFGVIAGVIIAFVVIFLISLIFESKKKNKTKTEVI